MMLLGEIPVYKLMKVSSMLCERSLESGKERVFLFEVVGMVKSFDCEPVRFLGCGILKNFDVIFFI